MDYRMRVAGLCLVGALATPASAFGGEDLLNGNPWHHEDISRKAALQAGFQRGAADAVAWHADYVDSYLYNPLWWAPGGFKRLKAALSAKEELTKVHFDDLYRQVPGSSALRIQMRRYLTGTLVGVIWAGEKDDVAAAQHIVGVSLHAIQDFYSHSNWIDAKDRRTVTWFDLQASAPRTFDSISLYTGAYETNANIAYKHHGKYLPESGIYRQPGVKQIMEVACSPFSPMVEGDMCQSFRQAKAGKAVRQASVAGVPIPGNVLFVNPPGIALDSTWLSKIGVKQRGLTDLTGPEAFDTAKGLAIRASAQWLQRLRASMAQAGMSAFWDRVMSTPQPQNVREAQFEDFGKMGYQFVSAGSYPPSPTDTSDEYFLRLHLRTSDDPNSGTDADIVATVDGRDFLLDNMPRVNPLIAYNDFEKGDDDVYLVGPFKSIPRNLVLANRAAGALDVLVAAGEAVVEAVEAAVTKVVRTVVNFFRSLAGSDPDYVGTRIVRWDAKALARVGSSPQAFTGSVNGGDEGRYRIAGTIRRVGRRGGRYGEESGYAVRLSTLTCDAESKNDRFSNSDEPFVMAVLNPLTGVTHKHLAGPYSDVDRGERRSIDHAFPVVWVPDSTGNLTLPLVVMESDDDSARQRRDMLDKLARDIDRESAPKEEGFLDTLGKAVAKDWKLASMEVTLFGKGSRASYGVAYQGTVNQWVKGGERATFPLRYPRGVRNFATAATLERAPAEVPDTLKAPRKPEDLKIDPPVAAVAALGIFAFPVAALARRRRR